MKRGKYYWLREDLKSSRNKCDIALILIENKRYEFLPTILESLYETTQDIIDKHCVKDLSHKILSNDSP